MQEKRQTYQNMSIRSPQAPSTLKVYNCCPRAGPAQVGGGAPRGAAGAGGGIFENTLLLLSMMLKSAAQWRSSCQCCHSQVICQNLRFQSIYISVRVTFSPSGPNSVRLGMEKKRDHERDFKGPEKPQFCFFRSHFVSRRKKRLLVDAENQLPWTIGMNA